MGVLKQNYSYAYNENGELIHVSSAIRGNYYLCPHCGEQMIPHMGTVRRWHFVHKNVENCSYESYLHNLAKIKIREAFLQEEPFMLDYNAKAICSYECPFIDSPKCKGEKHVEFDLRKYFDKCEIEASYNQFRADLLLSSFKRNFPPVLIEIMVTHKCTDDKINEGVRIIEIPIHSEEEIENIVNDRKLSAIRYENYRYTHSDKDQTTLYNFNKEETFDPADIFDEIEDCFYRENTIVFCLDQQGRFRTFDCRCYEVSKKLPPNIHYYITQIATPFKEIFQGFSLRGVNIRNCFLCKFSKQNNNNELICALYKKFGLPRKPSPFTASSCPYYKEDISSQSMQSHIAREVVDIQTHKCYYHICEEIL